MEAAGCLGASTLHVPFLSFCTSIFCDRRNAQSPTWSAWLLLAMADRLEYYAVVIIMNCMQCNQTVANGWRRWAAFVWSIYNPSSMPVTFHQIIIPMSALDLFPKFCTCIDWERFTVIPLTAPVEVWATCVILIFVFAFWSDHLFFQNMHNYLPSLPVIVLPCKNFFALSENDPALPNGVHVKGKAGPWQLFPGPTTLVLSKHAYIFA